MASDLASRLVNQTVQLNVKLPWALATGAKRLAAQEGLPVNTLIANLIRQAMVAEAASLRAQMEEQKEEVLRETQAFQEALAEVEQENERKIKQSESAR